MFSWLRSLGSLLLSVGRIGRGGQMGRLASKSSGTKPKSPLQAWPMPSEKKTKPKRKRYPSVNRPNSQRKGKQAVRSRSS